MSITWPHDLALAAASPRDPASPSAPQPNRLAWQREMERAQSEGWLGHRPPEGREGTPRDVGEGRGQGAADGGKPTRPALVEGLQVAAAQLRWSAPVAPSQPAAPEAPAALQMVRASRTAPLAGTPLPVPAPSTPPSPPLAPFHARPDPAFAAGAASASAPGQVVRLPLPGAREPLRLHVQWQGDEAQVWIGADAALGWQADELVEVVARWLTGQGLRVTRIVCNGVERHPGAPSAPAASASARLSESSTHGTGRSVPFVHLTASREY